MRKLIFFFATLCTVAFTSCDSSDNEFWLSDPAPVNLYLTVVDNQGNDLLDMENPDNVLEGTTLTFLGKTFEVSRERYEMLSEYEAQKGSRVLPATMRGLQLIKGRWAYPDLGLDQNKNYLEFGELEGGRPMDVNFTVKVPGAMTNVIRYYYISRPNERKKGTSISYFYWMLNGVRTNSNVFTITVDKN